MIETGIVKLNGLAAVNCVRFLRHVSVSDSGSLDRSKFGIEAVRHRERVHAGERALVTKRGLTARGVEHPAAVTHGRHLAVVDKQVHARDAVGPLREV